MRRRRDAGLTLIEILIAVAILSLMMIVAWGTTSETVQAKRHFEKVQERYRGVRAAMTRIQRDLAMAYVSGNEDTTLMDRRTFFIGESSSNIDTLRFSSLAHTALHADANESEQTIIAYYADPDPEDRKLTNLVRRETRVLANEKWDTLPAEADVLFRGITKFKLQYWNVKDKEWEDSWDTTSADGQPNRLPDRVKLTLTFMDERDKEVTFVTQFKVHLSEQLQFYAN